MPRRVSGLMPWRPKKHPSGPPVWKEINLSRSIGWGRNFPNLINLGTCRHIHSTNLGWLNDIFIDNPPINFCGLSSDKAHVIQNRPMAFRVIRGPFWHPSFDFISTKGTPRNEQTFKLMHRSNRNFYTPSPGQTSDIWLLSFPGAWGIWPFSRQGGENWTGSGGFQMIFFSVPESLTTVIKYFDEMEDFKGRDIVVS